jgi:hypothetical protein
VPGDAAGDVPNADPLNATAWFVPYTSNSAMSPYTPSRDFHRTYRNDSGRVTVTSVHCPLAGTLLTLCRLITLESTTGKFVYVIESVRPAGSVTCVSNFDCASYVKLYWLP